MKKRELCLALLADSGLFCMNNFDLNDRIVIEQELSVKKKEKNTLIVGNVSIGSNVSGGF